MGDEYKYQPKPHTNRKRGERKHHRTAPSVLENVRSKFDTAEPVEVNRKLVAENSKGPYQGVENPRDLKQNQNIQATEIEKKRISRDKYTIYCS